jgi:hypothetical protein
VKRPFRGHRLSNRLRCRLAGRIFVVTGGREKRMAAMVCCRSSALGHVKVDNPPP